MKVTFKAPRCIDGVTYQKGTQEVPDSLEKHPYFMACLQSGTASIVSKKKGAKGGPKPQVPPSQKGAIPQPPAGLNYQEQMEKVGSEADSGDDAETEGTQPEETAKERKTRLQRERRAAKKREAETGAQAAQ